METSSIHVLLITMSLFFNIWKMISTFATVKGTLKFVNTGSPYKQHPFNVGRFKKFQSASSLFL